jgi:steroid delta-isomerase-like uncharacterized protein
MEQNKALQRRYVEELNNGNAAFVEEYLHPDYVYHGPMGDMDKDQFSQNHAAVMAAFPDLQLTIESQVAEGDKVVMRWTGRGSHEGEFQGVAGTGTEVTITGITISRIEGEREVEAWEEINMVGLMQQLGILPVPEQGNP